MGTGDTRHIYKTDLDKDITCFQHDMAYGGFKDLTKRAQSDIVLKNKALKIARNPKYNGYERGLTSMVFKFLNSKSKGSGLKENLEDSVKNSQLADEVHKPIVRKFKKGRVYFSFKDNIWGVDLANMQLISKHNKVIRYLLCVIELFSKYAWAAPFKDKNDWVGPFKDKNDWVAPFKDKKGVSIVNAFQKVLDSSKRKPNEIKRADQGSEFHNNVFKTWLKGNDISMYSTYNEGKSVVAERFIKTLKDNIYKHMTTISKNVYFDVLDDIVDEYNNPEFKVGYHVRISKFKNVFPKRYTPNWNEEIFIVKRIKNSVPWTYIINDLNGEEIVGSFYEKELPKTNQKEFRIEILIKRKENKIYIKCKGCNNSFNSCIDKKDPIK